VFSIPDDDKFSDLKNKLKRGGINLFRKTPDLLPLIASSFLGQSCEKITRELVDSFRVEYSFI
jgi:hypothetical protein